MAQEIKKPETNGVPTPRYGDPFTAMRAEMERVFENFLGRDFGRFPSLGRGNGGGMMMPHIDVHESAKEIVVETELLDGLDDPIRPGDHAVAPAVGKGPAEALEHAATTGHPGAQGGIDHGQFVVVGEQTRRGRHRRRRPAPIAVAVPV